MAASDPVLDYHELTDSKKIMKAMRFPKTNTPCVTGVDSEILSSILDLSAAETSTSNSTFMNIAVQAVDGFRFTTYVSIIDNNQDEMCRALGTRSRNAFLNFDERIGNPFFFSGQERETERVHENSGTSGTKRVSVPLPFLPMHLKKK